MADPGFPFDFRDLGDGWFSWNLIDPTRYNSAVLGDLKVRREGDAARLRMVPERRHTNLGDNVHGATTLGLIDIALFAAMHMVGQGEAGPSVTLELSTQFVGAGDPDRPLDAVSEIVRETGRLVFLRGEVVQDDDVVCAYSGIIRKMGNRKK